MSNIKMIALDMDGTLLNDDGVVSPYTKRVIRQALEKKIHVVLSTGRPLAMCTSFIEELALPSYVITANGAEIWTVDEQLVERHTIETEKIETLWKKGRKMNVHTWLLASGHIFVDDLVPEDFSAYEWLKIGYGKLSEQEKQTILQKLSNDKTIEISNSSRSNIEVTKKGVHKARAIQTVCERLNVRLEDVMSVGDSLNDVSMIEQAGIGVAVLNAQRKVMEVADFITTSNNEDGVARAIEKFVL